MLIRPWHKICLPKNTPELVTVLEPLLTQLCGHPVSAVIIAIAAGLATGLFFRGADRSLTRFRYRFLGRNARHAYRSRRNASVN